VLTFTFFQKLSQPLLDLLFPPICVNCKTPNSWFCPNCLRAIRFIDTSVCARCGTPNPATTRTCEQCKTLKYIDGVRAAAYFEDSPIRSAIHFLKYRNHKAVAAILGQILADACRRYNIMADVIVPVPLHPTRYRDRGYNQSELLAKQVGQILGLSVNTDTLQRIRQTESQVQLGASERRQNVVNAFACNGDDLAGQTVLLVDDVYTTGSTLDACAAALKQSGVSFVWGVTLAKAR
jgi:ComF family protein